VRKGLVHALPVQVAEKAIFPSAERKKCHRRGHANIDANIAGVGLGAERGRRTAEHRAINLTEQRSGLR